MLKEEPCLHRDGKVIKNLSKVLQDTRFNSENKNFSSKVINSENQKK